MRPKAGDPAPDFSCHATDGSTIRLADFRGRKLVLYFYPMDDTPGCTVEAKGFQALAANYEKAGVRVLGVSPDGVASHCTFAGKYGLSFELLADENHEVAEKYGVWVEKSMYGKKYWGVQRSTFLIGRDGRIAKVWPKVKPEGHAEEVLEAAQSL